MHVMSKTRRQLVQYFCQPHTMCPVNCVYKLVTPRWLTPVLHSDVLWVCLHCWMVVVCAAQQRQTQHGSAYRCRALACTQCHASGSPCMHDKLRAA